MIFSCHIIAFVAGFLLDLLIGDPHWLYHPVRLIGKLISFLEKFFLDTCSSKKLLSSRKKHFFGILTVICVCGISTMIPLGILMAAYFFSPVAGIIFESVMTFQLLATKSLKDESMKVFEKLENGTLDEARKAVSMIVGRDTKNLSDEEVTKAAVETVAENTSDGIIAPMLFLAAGGPVLGFFYKSVNTMDSMIGYKNDRYMDFGRYAAKTDDCLNFLPSRISAILMIFSTFFLGKDFSAKNGWKIFLRDRFNHVSPNSAQTESACAGILGIRLAGPASYGGILENKPYQGDEKRKIQHDDIKRANALLYATSILCQILCVLILILIKVAKNAWR